jgi:hypothetical protein
VIGIKPYHVESIVNKDTVNSPILSLRQLKLPRVVISQRWLKNQSPNLWRQPQQRRVKAKENDPQSVSPITTWTMR